MSATGWGVWRVWVGHTMAGVAIGTLLMVAALRRGGLAAPVAALGGLATVAGAQWLALRKYRHAIAWWSWIAATILGSAAAAVAGLFLLVVPGLLALLRILASPLGVGGVAVATTLVVGALGGAVAGFTTALVLRRHFPGTGIWVFAAAVSGALSALVAVPRISGTALGVPLAPIAARIATGLVATCITGVAVARLVGGDEPNAERVVRTEPLGTAGPGHR